MTEQPASPELDDGPRLTGLEDPSELPVDDVQELFVTFQKALRAYQLYDRNNPVYKRFVTGLRDGLRRVWESVGELHIQVEESRLVWLGEEVYRNESRSDSLAFLLHKDGIRDITLLPGLEDEELEGLLSVLHRARNVRHDGDDLVTILWERDLRLFRYSYIDFLADGTDVHDGSEPDPSGLRALAAEELPGPASGEETEEAGPGSAAEEEVSLEPPGLVRGDDFNPTLYSLDPAEQAYLRAELERELERDLRSDVLSALFDRLEEPAKRDRQREILEILETLLPNLLGRGAIAAVSRVVSELLEIRERKDVLDRGGLELVERLVEELSSEHVVEELIRALVEGTIPPRSGDLAVLFRNLRIGALPALLRAAELEGAGEVAEVLRETVGMLTKRRPHGLLTALESSDPLVVAGAARVAGRIELTEAATHLARLVASESEAVRLAAVGAARSIPSSILANAVQTALDDPIRDIRIEAARTLGQVRYRPAAPRFEEIVSGKSIRDADVTEKIAVFEAFALLGGEGAVRSLARILNGRSLLRRKEPEELRAAAALALGKVDSPDARKALEKAEEANEAVVRSAVRRALRGEGG